MYTFLLSILKKKFFLFIQDVINLRYDVLLDSFS